MKQLKCEMCGSTDLIKQDGVFVCQTCGCKYSIEEARKMMVEGTVQVTGTVKVDNSAAIENYLGIARNALDAGNYKEADEYCSKIIEIDASNWAAWFIKGKAVGWQSTLGNIRIPETINAFSKALEYCPEDKKKGLGELCRQDLEDLHSALLRLRIGNFKTHPDDSDVKGLQRDVQIILDSTVGFLRKAQILVEVDNLEYARIINNGLCEALVVIHKDYLGDDGHPTDYEFKRFLAEGDSLIDAFKLVLVLLGTDYDNKEKNDMIIQIYKNMIDVQETLRDAVSYKVDFSLGWERYVVGRYLTTQAKASRNTKISEWKRKIAEVQIIEAKKVAEIALQRRDQYWLEHKEEKARLDNEKESLEAQKKPLIDQITELQKKKENVPALLPLAETKRTLIELEMQKKELGLFKIKEKRANQEQIESIKKKISDYNEQFSVQQAEIEKEIEPIRIELNKVIARIKAIESELTRDR